VVEEEVIKKEKKRTDHGNQREKEASFSNITIGGSAKGA